MQTNCIEYIVLIFTKVKLKKLPHKEKKEKREKQEGGKNSGGEGFEGQIIKRLFNENSHVY